MPAIATDTLWPLGTQTPTAAVVVTAATATTTAATDGSNVGVSERNNLYSINNRWIHIPTLQEFINSQSISLASFDVTDNKTEATTNLTYNNKRIYRMNDIFHREDERLKTFEAWPLEWMDKGALAQTGMFYTGDSDKVKCYFCEVEIGRWEETDNPVSEHMKWSPNCPLLRRRTTNNIPICAEALNRVLPPQSYDICGANDAIEIRPYAYAEGSIVMPDWYSSSTSSPPSSSSIQSAAALQTNSNNNNNNNNSSSNGCTPYYPEYPEYAIEAARVRSFNDWPRTMKQKPNQLSEAGFFYTGLGDRVKCFSCGGGLKDWDDTDDPWEQHALWLSKCRYLKLMKGQTYVDSVIAKYNATETNGTEVKSSAAASSSSTQTEEQVTSSSLSAAPQEQQHSNNLLARSNSTTSSNGSDLDETSRGVVESVSSAAAVSSIHSAVSSSSSSSSVGVVAASIPATEQQQQQQAEKRSIPEEKLCKICYVDEYNTAFLPCGHVVACTKCASSVTKCPLCRKPFTDVMRVYFS